MPTKLLLNIWQSSYPWADKVNYNFFCNNSGRADFFDLNVHMNGQNTNTSTFNDI